VTDIANDVQVIPIEDFLTRFKSRKA
jgi:hypothetical protein